MYSLTPKISTKVEKYINESNLFNLVNTFGSPLNIIIPEFLSKNALEFENIYKKYKLSGKIYYASKSNKSLALKKEARKTNLNIDCASINELKDALNSGFTGEQIEATGPKNEEFLILCIYHNILINIDSKSELEDIIFFTKKLNKKTNILIRLNELSKENSEVITKDSRFGIKDKEEIFNLILQNKEFLNLKGFSFHLPTISLKERVLAFENCIDWYFYSIKSGIYPNTINIGGGFGFNFLKSEKEWQNFNTLLKQSIINKSSEILTWNESGLGFFSENGKLKGKANFSDFYRSKSQFDELEDFLNSYSEKLKCKIYEFLLENLINLFIEPGRSLLDEAGFTVAKVIAVKKSLKNENLVILDINRSNLNAQDLEYIPDPILIKKEKSIENSFSAYLAGNLCLPHDFIMKRKVFFNQKPEKNDLIIFYNTSGYFMDFSESETLKQNIARKIAVKLNKQIYTDENYPFI